MQGERRWKLIPNCSLWWWGHGPSSWSLCPWIWSALWQAIPGWSWAEAGHTSEQSQDLAFLSAWHRERNHHLCHIVLRWLVNLNPRCHAKAQREVVRVRRKRLQVPHESQRSHRRSQSGCQMLSLPRSKAVAPRVPPKNWDQERLPAVNLMAVDFGSALLQISQSHIFSASTCCLLPPALPTSVCFSSHLSLQWIFSSYLFLLLCRRCRASSSHGLWFTAWDSAPYSFLFSLSHSSQSSSASSFTPVNHFLPSTFFLSLISPLPFLYHLFLIRCIACT